MKKYIPNILTFIRIISVIVGMILLLNNKYEIGIIILIMGTITDFFDGMLARKFNAVSVFGAKLDQISDKLFSLLTFIILIILGNKFLILNLIVEGIFTILSIIGIIKRKHWTETIKIGKIKTALLFFTISISLLLIKFKFLNIPFIIVWLITSLYQIYSNILIISKSINNVERK